MMTFHVPSEIGESIRRADAIRKQERTARFAVRFLCATFTLVVFAVCALSWLTLLTEVE